ncbi:MAG: ORF6N domain-containing protein [Bacteroidales bacterium]|nr:ORF6N domain-containing protein [Bacteroidales bacterium]
MEEKELVVLTEEYLMSKIYIVRGVQVMLDADLAAIYGYTTKNFNRQVKNNIERFDDDFRFQLTDTEVEILRCKNCTSSWGGTRYHPYAFTELGIYVLMTVLKGDLAVSQSKKLIRLFKKLKDFAIQIQNVLPGAELQALAIQTQNNTDDIRQIKQQMVTHDELSVVIKDFTDPNIKKDYLFYNGQAVEADLAYSEIYSFAKKTIHIIDNYIGLKTLALLKDVSPKVKVTIFSDNVNHGLHQTEFVDFQREYPNVDITLKTSGGIYHDRYIFIDHGTKNEMVFHCGGSSKDGGKRVTSISRVEDVILYQSIIGNLQNNPALQF